MKEIPKYKTCRDCLKSVGFFLKWARTHRDQGDQMGTKTYSDAARNILASDITFHLDHPSLSSVSEPAQINLAKFNTVIAGLAHPRQ